MHVVVVVSSYFYCSRCWHLDGHVHIWCVLMKWDMQRVHLRIHFFMISTFTPPLRFSLRSAPHTHINYEWHRKIRRKRRHSLTKQQRKVQLSDVKLRILSSFRLSCWRFCVCLAHSVMIIILVCQWINLGDVKRQGLSKSCGTWINFN